MQAQILQLLKDLQQQLGMAILLITHDLGIVRHMADRVYVMKDGNIVEHNAVRALFSDPQHDYTKLLINAEPSGNPPAIDQRAPLVIETRDLKVHFPILRGLLRCIRATSKPSTAFRSSPRWTNAGRRWRVRLGQEHAVVSAAAVPPSDGPIKFERGYPRLEERDLRPLRRQYRSSFRIPSPA